jgi:hypothetical protein
VLNNIFTGYQNVWNREKQRNSRTDVRIHGEAEDFPLEQNVEPEFERLLL